jgi:cobalt-zinc-cadmium efflux system membrane fusion protein
VKTSILGTAAFLCAMLLAGCSSGGTANSGEKNAAAPQASAGKTEIVIPVEQQRGVIESNAIEQTTASDVLRVPGRITLADNGTWRVGAITSGRIERVLVTQGDFVREGQVLARMHSHDVHEAKAEYLTAQGERSRLGASAALAQKNYERMQRLYALKAASLEQTELARQQAMDAQTALRSGQIAVERERAHLEENLGISADAGANPKNEVSDLIPIRAPASGYVLEKRTTPGSVVEPSTDLFVIGELQRLWMLASVNEVDWTKLRLGQSATITVNGLPDRRAVGKITDLGQQLDPLTHVLRVRIEFDNSKAKLRPEMLGEAQIAANTSKPALAVPADSIQEIQEQDVIFVRTSPDHFAMRPVRTGGPLGNRVIILEGAQPGDQVVTKGSFVLKSEMLKSSMESD